MDNDYREIKPANHRAFAKRNASMRIAFLSPTIASLLLLSSIAAGQERTVDFRYSPKSSFTVICFPDDWQKTVVTSSGSLGYDFRPGPYARPFSEISVGVKGETLNVKQQFLQDPHVPVVTTE